jgi:hypothetical protein
MELQQEHDRRGPRTAQRRAHAIAQHLTLAPAAVGDELAAHEVAAKLKRPATKNAGGPGAGAGAARAAKPKMKKTPFRDLKLEQRDVEGLTRLMVRATRAPPSPHLETSVHTSACGVLRAVS